VLTSRLVSQNDFYNCCPISVLRRSYSLSVLGSSCPFFMLLYMKRTADCLKIIKETRNADKLKCSTWKTLLRFVSFMTNAGGGGGGLLIITQLWSSFWDTAADNPRTFHLQPWCTNWLGRNQAVFFFNVTPICFRNLLLPILDRQKNGL
jgi:hypothetical protein